MLRLAWFTENQDAELLAYELIGLQYFNEGRMERAKFYHKRMLCAQFEPITSDIRRLGISRVESSLKEFGRGRQAPSKFSHSSVSSLNFKSSAGLGDSSEKNGLFGKFTSDEDDNFPSPK
jgi:hypothetical protein